MKERGVGLESEPWYNHVPRSVETSREIKVTILRNQQLQKTEPLLSIDRIS
jgi:hypothetical protein